MSRYENIKVSSPDSSRVNLNSKHVTTLDFFRLQPLYCNEMIPGDKFSVNAKVFAECAPLATKVYGACHLDLHAFFVPNRLLWKDWNSYILQNGATTPTIPYVESTKLSTLCGIESYEGGTFYNSVLNRERRRVFGSLGYPVNTYDSDTFRTNLRYSVLPARAYQKIYFDYYRDSRNIPEYTAETVCPTGDFKPQAFEFTPRYRCYMKDYVTTSLPSPQLGTGSNVQNTLSLTNSTYSYKLGDKYIAENTVILDNKTGALGANIYPAVKSGSTNGTFASNTSIIALRGALAMQKFLEKLGVSGTRSLERIFAITGTKPTDVRMQRAELVGIKSIPLSIEGMTNNGSSSMISNSGNAFGAPTIGSAGEDAGQGQQIGRGSAMGSSDNWNYTATEHGFFMVIASIVPDFIRGEQVERMFTRGLSTPNHDVYDFYTPELDGTGYEELLLSEVCTPNIVSVSKNNDWKYLVEEGLFDPWQVVGYVPRYESYRVKFDKISGDFVDYNQRNTMPNMVFDFSYSSNWAPDDVQAGTVLTTSVHSDRELFDNHFTVTNSDYDHFVINSYFINNAVRPISSAQLPTELSDLANSSTFDISNGGIRL